MRKSLSFLSVLVLVGLFLLSYQICDAEEIKYERSEAVDYAKKFCKDYNTEEYKCWNGKMEECENTGGRPADCANFVSQVMIDGGLDFACVDNANEIGKGENKGKKGEITVSQLQSELTENFCFEQITDRSKVKEGDILIWSGSHSAIYSGDNRYYAHTEDRCHSTGYESHPSNIWNDVRIYHFKDENFGRTSGRTKINI